MQSFVNAIVNSSKLIQKIEKESFELTLHLSMLNGFIAFVFATFYFFFTFLLLQDLSLVLQFFFLEKQLSLIEFIDFFLKFNQIIFVLSAFVIQLSFQRMIIFSQIETQFFVMVKFSCDLLFCECFEIIRSN